MQVLKLPPSIFLQIIGTLSGYFTSVLVARSYGPSLQGEYATLKSFADSAIVLLLMGFPQAIVLSLNRRETGMKVVLRAIPYYSIVTLLVCAIAGHIVLPLQLQQSYSYLVLACMSVAIGALVTFGLVRAALLTVSEGAHFALFTAAPQILFLICLAMILFLGSKQLHLAFLVQGLLVFVMSFVVAKFLFTTDKDEITTRPRVQSFLSENLHTFFQAILYTSQTFLFLFLTAQLPDGIRSAGIWSIAVLPIQIVQGITGIVAPYFYNRTSKSSASASMHAIMLRLGAIAATSQGAAIVAMPLLRTFTALMFGEGFDDSATLLTIVLFAVLPAVFTRTVSPFLQTSGMANLNTFSCVIRFLMSSLLALLTLYFELGLVSFAIAWLIAEWLAFLVVISWVLFNQRQQPP